MTSEHPPSGGAQGGKVEKSDLAKNPQGEGETEMREMAGMGDFRPRRSISLRKFQQRNDDPTLIGEEEGGSVGRKRTGCFLWGRLENDRHSHP